MIKGVGVDIVDLNRIKVESNFAHKILSENEYALYLLRSNDKLKKEFLGGRFAGKEAFLKANGMGLGEMNLKDIEILSKDSGQPFINFPDTFISISHEKDYVIAYVVIEER